MTTVAMNSIRRGLRQGLAGLLRASGATEPGRRGAERLVVVTFHRVLPEAQRRAYPLPGLAVTPEELEWFLGFFRHHFRCGSLREAAGGWERGETDGRPWLALTFDDGQRDNFQHARPLLARAGVHASFYVPVDHIASGAPLWHDRVAFAAARLAERGEGTLLDALGPARDGDLKGGMDAAKAMSPEEREDWICRAERVVGAGLPDWDGMMSWEQLRQLAGEGHEVGSHSQSHALLPQLGDEALEREVAGSRAALEAELGVTVDSFCYPNGDHDARSLAAVERAGYRRAVTTAWGSNPPGTSPFALKRFDMTSGPLRGLGGQLSEAVLAWRLSGLHPGLP